MSSPLEAFLAAEDLDELLRLRAAITMLSPEEETTVRAILNKWDSPQAISNLLFHPDLIPEELRLPMLLRGLTEREMGYYILAAIVGLQSLDAETVDEANRQRLLTELLLIAREAPDSLANRASVTFQDFAKVEDAPQIFALLSRPNQTVFHNARAWLFRTFQGIGHEALAEAGRESGSEVDLQQQIIQEFVRFLTDPPPAHKSPLFLLYSYIPNLRNIFPSH